MTTDNHNKFFHAKVNETQAKDTGMAMVMILLLIAWFTDAKIALGLAIPVLVINMVFPRTYTPLAKVWMGISNVFGFYTSKLLLSLIFFLIVTPVGIVRRWMGADPMRTREWKKSNASVFSVRDYIYGPEDVEKPY